jgi:hypothetical protein
VPVLAAARPPAWTGKSIVLADMRQIALDPNPRWVFVFIFVVCAGMVLVSSLQMFVYDDFIKFPAWQKSIAHGNTMVGMALGAWVCLLALLAISRDSVARKRLEGLCRGGGAGNGT